VESLSKNLESRFSSLSVQNAKIEDSLTKLKELFTQKVLSIDEIIVEFEKMNTYLKGELKKIKSAFQTVQAGQTSKINRKEVVEALTKTGEAITVLGNDIKGVRSKIQALGKIASDLAALDNDVKVLDKKLTDELVKLSTNLDKDKKELAGLTRTVSGEKQKLTNLAETTDGVKKDLTKLKTDISDVSAGKMDKELMEFILKKHQQNFMTTMDKSTREIRDDITSLRKKIRDLEKISRQSTRKNRSRSVGNTPPKPQKSELKSTKKATKRPVPLKPGNITEQDIRQ
jgi:hypothetical protein